MYRYFSLFFLLVLVNFSDGENPKKCTPSVTTVSGTRAPQNVCAGELIFEDNFNKLDFKNWQHDSTLSGGGNFEFQWYTNNRTNSYVRDGNLFIKPTLTADYFGGEQSLYSTTLNLNGESPATYCTDLRFWGCERTGTPTNILNPIRSAKLTTINSFAFKFGKLQVRAKMPSGDWLWPAIWMLPRYNEYGNWPTSGEIDLVESRGNENLNINGVNIGVDQMASTLHWGPDPNHNQYQRTQFIKQGQAPYRGFKVYEVVWTPDSLIFSVDGQHLGTVQPKVPFWDFGQLASTRLSNPWQYGSNFAPFDQEYYLIMNLAVGGTGGYFPDEATNTPPKPWKNSSPQGITDFWKGKSAWYPTWKPYENNGESAALQIDYVKVWAL